VVAAAIRRPAQVVGTGQHSVNELIQIQSRRRRAATGGESSIPMDDETERCVRQAGYGMDDILPEGEVLVVRKTANLHTGGTIHDVHRRAEPGAGRGAREAARALDIPVTGLDFLVPDVTAPTMSSSRPTSGPAWPTTSPSRPPSASSICCFRRPRPEASCPEASCAHPESPRLKALPIDTEYLLDILLKLLFTPSPSGYTDRVVHLVCEELERSACPSS
jgi:hypothetical protein